jgi:hypothetical protein
VALSEIERRNGGRGEDSPSVENSGFVTRSDKQLVAWIQSSVQLRRAVSDLVQILQHLPTPYSAHNMSPHHLLCEQVLRIYPRLLELPRLDAHTFAFEISLVVPFYDPAKPSTSSASPAATQLEVTIRHALRMCHNPSAVQLIVVTSRDNVMDSTSDRTTAPDVVDDKGTDRLSSWGATKCLVVPNRGRGPCLNAGAQVATGRILVFCHADTKQPAHWDVAVSNAYRDNSSRQCTVLATAFSFGVDNVAAADEGPEGLVPCGAVPGLNAVVTTANLRSRWFSLPYGDQCISVPSSLFVQVGGFPDVPLMEDYELISCLRQRQEYSLFRWTKEERSKERPVQEQRIVILSQQVRCCPRRWVRHGVPWVTITNSRLVREYHRHQLTAHELYRQYYGASVPDPQSPSGSITCTT